MGAGVIYERRHKRGRIPLCDKHDTILVTAVATCERQLNKKEAKGKTDMLPINSDEFRDPDRSGRR
jgi:hypothetical protein